MPNTYACKLVSNPNVPIFLPRVCTLVLFIHFRYSVVLLHQQPLLFGCLLLFVLLYLFFYKNFFIVLIVY